MFAMVGIVRKTQQAILSCARATEISLRTTRAMELSPRTARNALRVMGGPIVTLSALVNAMVVALACWNLHHPRKRMESVCATIITMVFTASIQSTIASNVWRDLTESFVVSGAMKDLIALSAPLTASEIAWEAVKFASMFLTRTQIRLNAYAR